MLRKLWNDEGGSIFSSDGFLVAAVVVIGLAVGLPWLRAQIVQDLAGSRQTNQPPGHLEPGEVSVHSLFLDGCDGEGPPLGERQATAVPRTLAGI